ncbi:MAG: redoxin domain-containing protein [Flavobacteriales bacterium]|nr:redoxin domain-containing protein [Flavobacteriales bacterium]
MQQFVIILSFVLGLAACGNEPAQETKTTKEATVAKETSQTEVAPALISGTTDKNRGEKMGNVTIDGKILKANKTWTIYLYETKGKNHYVIDSTKIQDGNFSFKKKLGSGFYMIGGNSDANMMAFIVNPDEENIQLQFNSGRLESAPVSVNSNENEGWFAYFKEEKAIEAKIKSLRNQRKNSSFKERINKQIAEQEQLKITTQQNYIKQYPDTYLAKFLDWKTADSKQDKGSYWNDIDFSDKSLMRSIAIPDRIQDYMRSYSDGSESSFYNLADLVKDAASQGEDDDVLQFTLFTMADGFYQSNKENVVMYIIDNHILGEDCGMDPGDMLQAFIQNVNDLQVGGTPPNIIGKDTEGNGLNLEQYARQGEYTLVIFWASWCHKCEQEMPVLNQVYDRFKDQGFQVVAYSVDQNETAWKRGIEEKQVPGRNVSGLAGWKSKAAKDYRVTQTPTSFLINGQGEIVLKPKRIFEVDNYLRQNLK